MSDDIYEHIIYDEFNFYTPAQNNKIFDRTLTVNGVSKSYAMTGWRIGYAGGPVEIIKGMAKLQSQSTTNPSSISQAAAVEALKGDQGFIKTRKEVFKKRRDFIVEMLNKINGVECIKPQGAFYVFPSCKKLLGKKHQKLGLIKDDKGQDRWAKGETTARNERRYVLEMQQGNWDYKSDGIKQLKYELIGVDDIAPNAKMINVKL